MLIDFVLTGSSFLVSEYDPFFCQELLRVVSGLKRARKMAQHFIGVVSLNRANYQISGPCGGHTAQCGVYTVWYLHTLQL